MKELYGVYSAVISAFTYPVEKVVKIRTGEEGADALQDVE